MKHNMNTISDKLGGKRVVISMDERTHVISCILLELLSPHLNLNLQNFFLFLLETKLGGEDLQYIGYLYIQLDN